LSLQLRRLQLRVTTTRDTFGADLQFAQGLVVLRADNTTGKSTCIQAVLYALGLEGMLGPSRAVPLPHAMTTRIADDRDGTEVPVLQSEVVLEVSNADGEIMTVQRWVKHETIDTRLISVWDGPVLSEPKASFNSRGYFARVPGAAQREAGFHHYLANFLGWSLPDVPRYDGTAGPLYVECLFPLFIVEQKHGWAGILTQMPTYLRIREPARRAVEFVLALDTQKRALRLQALEQRIDDLRQAWNGALDRFDSVAAQVGAVLQHVSRHRVGEWDANRPPAVVISASDEWIELPMAIRNARDRLEALHAEEIPTALEDASSSTEELARAEENLQQLAIAVVHSQQDVASARETVVATGQRIAALREDQHRYQDSLTLQKFGSTEGLDIAVQRCPTCHQELSDAVLLDVRIPDAMSLEDNVAFIDEQIRTFRLMEGDGRRALQGKEARLQSLLIEVGETRRRIRELRKTLVADTAAVSAAAVAERIRLTDHVDRLRRLELELTALVETLRSVGAEWADGQSELSRLRSELLSDRDRQKLDQLEGLLQEQLRQFGFRSLPIGEINISDIKYTPNHEGFDLGFDLSASDMIRTIWAYLLGLLELSRLGTMNHVGLLILDEPRQQETAAISFVELLRRASESGRFNQQVIFATSEEELELKQALGDVPHVFLTFPGKILSPVGTEP
jgi:hypothetical protein